MFMVTRNWLMIPQFLYYVLFVGGELLTLVSVGMIIYSAMKKKSMRHILCWLIVLVIGVLLAALTMTGKIVGHMMVGG